MKVSAVILTHNEEVNIERCLRSLVWCDDILVVDSGSTDGTVGLCERMGARVIGHDWTDFATQRNFALDSGELKHDWVLHLDADEEATPAFAIALERLAPPDQIWGFRVPSRTILFGRWLRRAGMYPAYQVRIGHAARCRFIQHGHGQREDLPPNQVGLVDEPYDHHAFSHGLRRWFVKHVGYAQAEADQIVAANAVIVEGGDKTSRRRRLKSAANRLPPLLRPLARFFYMTVVRRGALDGLPGLCYCSMSAVYETMIAVFLIEKRFARRGVTP